MKYLIIIEFDANPKAATQLSDAIDVAIMEATMEGGITSLGSQELRGKEAQRWLNAASGTTKTP